MSSGIRFCRRYVVILMNQLMNQSNKSQIRWIFFVRELFSPERLDGQMVEMFN